MANNVITADGGAGSINIDTTTDSGFVILSATAVPEPATLTLAGIGGATLVLLRRRTAKTSRE